MLGRVNSAIRVLIQGDAKSLQKAAAQSEAAVGGISKTALKAGAIVAGAFATDALLDFGKTALDEADRVGDAAGKIEAALGPDLSRALLDRADDFSRIGGSEGDMLELESRLIDIGTAAGIADTDLAPMAESAAQAAAAMALIDTEGRDANFWIEKIGKAAASGDMRSLQELGVNLDEAAVNAQALADTGKPTVDALTDAEKSAAAYKIIMEQLAPKIDGVVNGQGDLEQSLANLDAKFETLTGKIGGHLEGPLNDLAQWVLDGIDGWELLGTRLDEAGVDMGELIGPVMALIAPFIALNGVIGRSIDLLGQFFATSGQTTTRFGGTAGPRAPGIGGTPNRVTVNVNGGSPEVIEQSVRNALRIATGRGPLE